MDSKIISKLRQVLGLSKKYTDEKVTETKQYVDQKFAAFPVHEIPVIPVDEIAAQVVAMMPKSEEKEESDSDQKEEDGERNSVSPEDVMAMISASLSSINIEYQKTGDNIIINEAPQRVVEHIKEVIREKGGEVDYNLIFIEVEKQMHRIRTSLPVGSNSLRGLIDVDLTGVQQDTRGNYLLGQSVASVTWDYYATNWSTSPTFIENITGGAVYLYVLDSVNRYRFVPNPYDSTTDAFYTNYSSPTLSNLIITRG